MTARELALTREKIAGLALYYGPKDKPERLAWGRDAFADTLNAYLRGEEVDPLEEWLYWLPPWDGTERIDVLLNMMFDVPLDMLSVWASRYLVLGVIQRTLEPGCKLDEIPVLIGPQGIGKSALLRSILPPEMPDLFDDSLKWDATGKEQVESVLGKAIVEVSEMAGRRRAEIEHIKAFITRQDDGNGVRLAYASGTEPHKRRFVIVATTNNETDLPNDPSGNRRFVAIPMTANKCGSVERFMDRYREQLWAECLELFNQGHRANLPREWHALQRSRAEEHRDRDDLLEDAIEALHSRGPLKLAEIMLMLGEAARDTTQHRIGRALRNAGWTLRRVKRGGKNERLWVREAVPL
ncbi:MAG: hypothetical protein OXI20_10395 [Rhodospirillales bacterium]|nr:hypothetical protein [Rhodospirillales bacterium]